MTIDDLLIELYDNDLYEKTRDTNKESFYRYSKLQLEQYRQKLLALEEAEIKYALSEFGFFIGPITKRRFINAVSEIINKSLDVLSLCYKGDMLGASEKLEKLLLSKPKLKRYLSDYFINLFKSSKKLSVLNSTLYRMRDDKKEEIVNDCWHVPYEKRYLVSTNRYNVSGFPCLYLSDSKETASKEIGELKKGYVRWFSKFKLKSDIWLFDLCTPIKKDILKMSNHDKISLLLTYSIRFLCTSKAATDGAPEEYYFSQLLSHILMKKTENPILSFKGIVFSSTKNKGGINYMLPAYYDNKEPVFGFSIRLLNLFETTNPEVYE